jgi:hypothetical protein
MTDPSQIADDSVDMKARIETILTETGFSDSRAAKMDIDDLLKYAFPPYRFLDRIDQIFAQASGCFPRQRHPFCISLVRSLFLGRQ